MGKLLKKAIWDFHKHNILSTGALPVNTNICTVLLNTVNDILINMIAYATIAGIPMWLASSAVLYFFVGLGEMEYVNAGIIAIIYMVVILSLWFTCMALGHICVYLWSKLPQRLNVRDKVCFKVDFKDMED